MKFLTISSLKDTFSTVPPAIARQLVEATLAWTNEQKKAGKILEVYEIVGGGTAVICEHPSLEDLVQTLASIPMGGFMNLEVHPLADFNQAMEVYIEGLKTAEKLFPSPPK